MKKILVTTDFSANAKHALLTAADIAHSMHAALEILHVNTAVAYAPVLSEYYPLERFENEDYNANAATEIHALKRDLTQNDKFANMNIESRVEEGYLHNTLRNIAEEDGCDMIVMGTKGVSGVAEFFVGSNTEKVIRTAPCPVLVVPQNSGSFNLQTVVFPTTLKADQAVVFNTLAEWQKTTPFKVKALYLNNPAGFDSSEAIEAACREMCEKFGLKDTEVYSSANTFNEEMAILRFADECGADMIAMATHQRRGISHMLFGSLSEDTANHSHIPVLVVPVLEYAK